MDRRTIIIAVLFLVV